MRSRILASIVLLAAAAGAGAQEAAPAASPASPPSSGALSAPLSIEELAAISGGQAVKVEILTAQNLTATVTDNNVTAYSIQSGAVSFGANALNFSGIGNFVVNTGSNNVLQGSLSVTVVNAPPP